VNAPAYQFFDMKPVVSDMREEVLRGLKQPQKQLSPKYFYDTAGSELFEAITELPEYYLTRTELALFDAHGADMARRLGDGGCLIEYGSGSNVKIRKLLKHLRPAAYVPVDISGEHLEANARDLRRDFPNLRVYPTCADFTAPLELPPPVADLPRAGFFPGSSIGNFTPEAARRFLRNCAHTLGAGGRLLIGVDRKKSVAVLEAAYNDAQGVTARFNLNLLEHLNDVVDADFDLDAFRHQAVYDTEAGCIRMFLVSARAQSVRVAGEIIEFAEGERLHTENSYKYTPEEFAALSREAGLAVDALWTDAQERFAVFALLAD
jgi:dimethylhistidine N-methyltransferase